MFDLVALDTLRSIEDLTAHAEAARTRLAELDTEAKGLPFNSEQQAEWAAVQDRVADASARITELTARHNVIAAFADDPKRSASGFSPMPAARRTVKAHLPDDLHDATAYRQMVGSIDELPALKVDGARKIVDTLAVSSESGERLTALLRTIDNPGVLADRVIGASGPLYMRAFGKLMTNQPLTSTEQAALGTYTNSGADGGYAVPVELDPSLILTSDGVVNPIRQISRVIPITGKVWLGVSSGSISVSRVAENTAVTAVSPTLAQPTATPTAVKGLIEFSIEVGQDWGALQSEMARLLADAKDVEESASFITGTGNGTTGPQGITRMADTSIVWTQASGNFGVEDVYALETDPSGGNGLPPRFRPRASFLGNKAVYSKIRQFSAGANIGEGNIWVRGIATGQPPELLGYPAFEASEMYGLIVNAHDILILGDFSNFAIVDRVGMSVELIPHLFDGDGKPTGSRGIWAMWRNTSLVLVDNAFRKLRVGEGS